MFQIEEVVIEEPLWPDVLEDQYTVSEDGNRKETIVGQGGRWLERNEIKQIMKAIMVNQTLWGQMGHFKDFIFFFLFFFPTLEVCFCFVLFFKAELCNDLIYFLEIFCFCF